ncbi:MAG: heavy metal translocating P-type ATPase [Oscillospiraceae bacterium]
MDKKWYSAFFAGVRERFRGRNHDHSYQEHEHHSRGHESCGKSSCGCGHNCGPEKSPLIVLIRVAAAILLIILELVLTLSTLLSYSFVIAAFLIAGYDIILSAIKGAAGKDFFNEKLLMAVAGIAAMIIGKTHEAVIVMVLSQVGDLLQDSAVRKSRNSITGLMDMRPDKVKLMTEEGTVTVPAEDVKPGDIFIVSAGERIPLDGVVISGSSELDTSSLTGESLPRPVSEGEEVFSGCINVFGGLKIRATSILKESTAQRILDLVENSDDNNSNTEKFITRFARYYTPAIFALAFLIGVPLPLIFRLDFSDWLYRALVLLVISCPCALIISIPLTYFAGIGGASARGILFKGANVVDEIASATTAIFDKTGTLTTGQFDIVSTEPIGIGSEDLLFLAAYAEASSTHPIARSIVKNSGVSVDHKHITDFREKRGRGILTRLSDGRIIIAGSTELVDELGIEHPFGHRDSTSVLVCLDEKCVGCINLGDKVKPDAKKAVTDLISIGVDRVVMITGDKLSAAQMTAAELGIPEFHAECMPDMKLARIKSIVDMQGEGEKAIFVGDGINDVPVITAADIGIAMGGLGADAAIEAADVVIMNDQPSKVAEAISTARSVRRILWQNIFFSVGVKAVVLILGIAGIASMWMAIFADVGVAVLAVINAMRAFNVEIMDLKHIFNMLKAK